jgi:hypothetical protein
MTEAVFTPLVMPPEIASSIVKVAGNIKMVVKDHLNKHGGYNYASVDNFYSDMGPILSDAGLIILMNELESKSDGKWLHITFAIHIYHSSGKSYGPVIRTQGVMANGPQAYAAAQSFTEKYFLRSLFKIPTGEAETDADAQAKQPIPASSVKFITEEQLDELLGLITETGSDPVAFLKYMNVKNIGEIKQADFAKARSALIKKKETANV